MIHRLFRLVLLLVAATLPVGVAVAQTTTFGYTGNTQTFTVPAGVTSVTLTALGGGGGGGGDDASGYGGAGGNGGAVSGNYAVTPGTLLSVYVGGGGGLGASGANCTGGGAGGNDTLTGGAGGGAGCSGSSGGGGGGGAPSGVATSSGTILIAAGGGGGGQGGAYTANAGLSGGSSTASGTVSTIASGNAGTSFNGDGGGGGGGGGGCPAGSGGIGHADGTNAGSAGGAGGSCAATPTVTNFQVLGAVGGAGGAGSTSSVTGTAGGNGSVTISYGASTAFIYTGSMQTYTVPTGVSWVTITLDAAGGGGAGADSSGNGGNGGYGASVSATYPVTAGSVLDIYVGGGGVGGNSSTGSYDCTDSAGAGGWSDFGGGGGGEAGCSGWSGSGGGGGGASAVATSSGTVLLVAGGGGGGQGGALSNAGIAGGNSSAAGTLPASAGAAGAAFTTGGDDGGGGGGGGGGCAGGTAGTGHADGTTGGTTAGAGGSCANTTLVSNFQVLGEGEPGGAGAQSTGVQGSTGSNGIVLITSSTGPNHYDVTHASTGVNCQPVPVTIVGHTVTHTVAAFTTTITVTTGTGHGDWTLTTGSGTFVAGASNSGYATYTYVTGDTGSVVLSLRDTYAETVTVNVTDGLATQSTGSAIASENTPLTFVASGFRFTNGANVATSIGTQLAGVTSTQSLALQAIRTDTSTGACTNVFASGQTANVSLAFQCNNPAACVSGQTFSFTNNGTTTSLPSNSNSGVVSYATVPLKFSTANAEAPFTLNYSDAGQITLTAKYAIPLGSGAASANTLAGSGQFVVQPYALKLSNVKTTANGTANPGASTASGPVFMGAGQLFTSTVTATNYQGGVTPNFGQETTPATVTLTPTLVLPASGDDPAVTGGFNPFVSGAATGTTFAWPEVGIITLTPVVANYLSSGMLTGTASANVGRFVPNSFGTAVNTPVFGTACVAGSFTYVGQPFVYTIAPVVTVTALAMGGATTKNYTGSLMRLTNSSLTGRTYTPTPSSPGLTLTGLPATTVDPVIADLGTGQITLTFSAGSGLSFARGTATPPFSADVALSVNVIDQDAIAASNPVTFGSGSGIGWSSGASQYYGRLMLRNSLGSELLDLPAPLTAQYYLNTSQGFVTNTADSCTTAPALAFSNYLVNLNAGETCVRDSGNPGSSGQGCAAAASNRYFSAASSGSFNLILAAPGAGNTGAVTITATAPAWLQYLWNAGSGVNTNPAGMATFGVYPGSTSRVYQREVY